MKHSRSRSSTINQRKFEFIVTVISVDKNGNPVKAENLYQFKAVSFRGALSGASRWYKSIYESVYPFSMPNNWVPDFSEERPIINGYVCDMLDGRMLHVQPLKLLDKEDTSQFTPMLEAIRENPTEFAKKYADKLSKIIDALEVYFLIKTDEYAGQITRQVKSDANLVYDWTGAPQMLSRAFDMSPGQLRDYLGTRVILRCPNCGKEGYGDLKRIKGGVQEGYFDCRKCGAEMEIKSRIP